MQRFTPIMTCKYGFCKIVNIPKSFSIRMIIGTSTNSMQIHNYCSKTGKNRTAGKSRLMTMRCCNPPSNGFNSDIDTFFYPRLDLSPSIPHNVLSHPVWPTFFGVINRYVATQGAGPTKSKSALCRTLTSHWVMQRDSLLSSDFQTFFHATTAFRSCLILAIFSERSIVFVYSQAVRMK